MSLLLDHAKAYRALAAGFDTEANRLAGDGDRVPLLRSLARAHRHAAEDLEEQARAGCTGEAPSVPAPKSRAGRPQR